MKERVKNILLAALLLLAVYLTLRVWIYDETLFDSPSMAWAGALRGLLGYGEPEASPDQGVEPEIVTPCAWPVKLAVKTGNERLGAAYNTSVTEAMFSVSEDVLREALATASEPSAVYASQWFEALAGECIYIEYETALPLSVIASWIYGSCPLSGNAKMLALCSYGDTVRLWYGDGQSERYYMAETRARTSMMPSGPEGLGAKACFFAYERRDIVPNAPQGLLIMEENDLPLMLSSAEADATLYCSALLNELQMPEDNLYEEPNGTLVYVDNLRTCSVSKTGRISYRNPSGESGDAQHSGDSVSIEIERARKLVEPLGQALGNARMVLCAIDGETYRFSAQAGGVSIEGGAFATVEFSSGEIIRVDAYLRRYSAGDEVSLLLPAVQAAALLPRGARDMSICYIDMGAETSAQWVARD